MKTKSFLILTLLLAGAVLIQVSESKKKVATGLEFYKGSVYVNIKTVKEIMVDFDGDNTTAAYMKYTSETEGSSAAAGTCFLIYHDIDGVLVVDFITHWGFSVAERLYIMDGYVTQKTPMEWHFRASTIQGGTADPSSSIGEWFGYTLTKNTPPTDWVFVLHNSNGTSMLPVTMFSYSVRDPSTGIIGLKWTKVGG